MNLNDTIPGSLLRARARPMKVVTGVIGNDIHVVANRLVELSLIARGFKVYNLGVNTPLTEFFDAMVETGAEILLISSLNGEADGWSEEVSRIRSAYRDLNNIIMMIGGNLCVGSGDALEINQRYMRRGFDLVCHQVDLNTGLDMLEHHILKLRARNHDSSRTKKANSGKRDYICI